MKKINLKNNSALPKSAFTFAEALMAMFVVGLAAVLIVSPFIMKIGDKTMAAQKTVFDKKLHEGMRRMQLAGALSKDYASTEEFLEEFRKHFQVSATCKAPRLDKCFTEFIKTDSRTILLKIPKISSSTAIEAKFETESEVIGLIFADGTRAIMAYEPYCTSVTDIYNEDENLTSCIAMYYDVNGTNGPNIVGNDIFSENITPSDVEIGTVFSPTLAKTCEEIKASGVTTNGKTIQNCHENYNEKDYWANAVYACAQQGKRLPTRAELQKIATKLYGEPIALSGTTSGLAVANPSIYQALGSPKGVYFWSSEEYSATYA